MRCALWWCVCIQKFFPLYASFFPQFNRESFALFFFDRSLYAAFVYFFLLQQFIIIHFVVSFFWHFCLVLNQYLCDFPVFNDDCFCRLYSTSVFHLFKKKTKKHKTIYLSVALAIAWRQMHRERNGAEKHSISIMELIRCRKIVTKYEHTQSFYPQFHSIYWQFFNYIGPSCIENRFKFNWNLIWEKWKTRFTALFIPLNKCFFF